MTTLDQHAMAAAEAALAYARRDADGIDYDIYARLARGEHPDRIAYELDLDGARYDHLQRIVSCL